MPYCTAGNESLQNLQTSGVSFHTQVNSERVVYHNCVLMISHKSRRSQLWVLTSTCSPLSDFLLKWETCMYFILRKQFPQKKCIPRRRSNIIHLFYFDKLLWAWITDEAAHGLLTSWYSWTHVVNKLLMWKWLNPEWPNHRFGISRESGLPHLASPGLPFCFSAWSQIILWTGKIRFQFQFVYKRISNQTSIYGELKYYLW